MHLLERQTQLDELARCFQEARKGCGKLLLISAEAGLGKSSLVERFVSEHRRDARTFWGACDGLSTPRALAPVHEIAAQIAQLGSPLTRDGEFGDHLFRILLEELARPERVSLVVLEDLHWADAATLDFVRFIGRRIQRTSALFIATYREDELSPSHPLRLALGELTGHHVVRMRLVPLSPAAVELLSRDSGRNASLLYRITGGNPFFVREVLASPGELVPQSVRDAVVSRLLRCSPETRELAELVAISPGRTEGWLIESVLGARQPAVDEAGARGLLEVQTDSIGFRHELARRAVLEAIQPERVRALHAQVLPILAQHGTDPARLTHHASLARLGDAVLEYAPLAAKEAARLSAGDGLQLAVAARGEPRLGSRSARVRAARPRARPRERRPRRRGARAVQHRRSAARNRRSRGIRAPRAQSRASARGAARGSCRPRLPDAPLLCGSHARLPARPASLSGRCRVLRRARHLLAQRLYPRLLHALRARPGRVGSSGAHGERAAARLCGHRRAAAHHPPRLARNGAPAP